MPKKEFTKKINLEQIIAGCLTIWGLVDGYTLTNVIDTLEENGFEVERPLDFKFTELQKYVYYQESISPKGGYAFAIKKLNLESFNQNRKDIYEKLREITPPELCEFFERSSTSSFLSSANIVTEANKRHIIEDANVLLISDREEDLEAFKNYGFKNISYFASLLRANTFFESDLTRLDQYHIFVIGPQITQNNTTDENTPLEDYINDLKKRQNILTVNLAVNNHQNDSHFIATINNYTKWPRKTIKAENYDDLFESLLQGAKSNGIFFSLIKPITKEDMKTTNVQKRIDLPKDDRPMTPQKPFPTSKEELKILYLDPEEVTEGAEQIAEDLGLNVTFLPDNDFTFDEIKTKLGEYDIIIGSHHSSKLSQAGFESTQQSRDTGTPLIILASYDWNTVSYLTQSKDIEEIGLNIKVEYQVGGHKLLTDPKLKPSKEPQTLDFRIATDRSQKNAYNYIKRTMLHTLLNALINLYDDELFKIANIRLEEHQLKSPKSYTQEYDKKLFIFQESEHAIVANMKRNSTIIREINYIEAFVKEYLRLLKDGIKFKPLEDMRITESNKGIKIELLYKNTTICAMTLSKRETDPNIRIFTLETLNYQKRKLVAQTLTAYLRPPLRNANAPTDEQINIISTIHKRIQDTIVPLLGKKKQKIIEEKLMQLQPLHNQK